MNYKTKPKRILIIDDDAKPQAEVSASAEKDVIEADTDADVSAFFIHDGIRYDAIAFNVESRKIMIDRKVAEIEDRIDPGTPESEYGMEDTGSLGGVVYAVEGYDEAGLLCMPAAGGEIVIFVSEGYRHNPDYTGW